MVEKYVILACSNDRTFDVPRQLVEINGEKIIERTIRLLRENGIDDITITVRGNYFDYLDVKIYKPTSTYDYINKVGYWLDAFPNDLLDDKVCFIWGDVYFSEEAINTIVKTEINENTFFCSHDNNSKYYIKEYDEPFAYKIVDTDLFKKHIEIVKKLFEEGKTIRHPIVWEVYRSMNGIDVNKHLMTKNYVVINDITCDIDSYKDRYLIESNVLKIENERLRMRIRMLRFDIDSFREDNKKLISYACDLEDKICNLNGENQRLNHILNELERHLEQEILEWQDVDDEWTKAQVQEDKIILDKLKELKESDK